ncbi:MAG TPA: transporter [Flavobacteriales bacterium]|nr:transporter [Flavobacteriales bacterium]
MKVLKLLFLFAIILFFQVGKSQNDTSVFKFVEYMNLVKSNHPIAMVADLAVEKGQANVRSSRGSFDPILFQDMNNKQFNDQEYYRLSRGGLKVPTWFGMDFEGGLQQSRGDYLNPQNNLPNDGLLFAGVTVPIGQGLFIDKRRADLKTAKLYSTMTVLERRLILNDLLLEAGKAYWSWFTDYNNVTIYEDALELARERFNAVKSGVEYGDRPSMDTLEAGIQVQTRLVSLQEARLKLRNSMAMLSVYLWQDGYIPLELNSGTIPEEKNSLEQRSLNVSLQKDSLIARHPKMQQTRLDIDRLNIEQKLKKEQLKPVLNVKYNVLMTNNQFAINQNQLDNYVFGLGFKMPIFLRKERGELKLARIKIQEANLKLVPQQANLMFKFQSALNEWEVTESQIQTTKKMVADYFQLLQGERKLFEAGESSLFLVNSREVGYIAAQVKLAELMGKNQEALLKTDYALGRLNEVM